MALNNHPVLIVGENSHEWIASHISRMSGRPLHDAAILWMQPGKTGYTKEMAQEIRATAAITRDADNPYVVIIEAAEQLLPAAANSLLKLLEEPPAHWHILLTTQIPQALLRTIRSRCLTIWLDGTTAIQKNTVQEWAAPFGRPDMRHFAEVLLLIDQHKPSESMAERLVDTLLVHLEQFTGPQKKILLETLKAPPAPGGAKIFLRNLYIRLAMAQPETITRNIHQSFQ